MFPNVFKCFLNIKVAAVFCFSTIIPYLCIYISRETETDRVTDRERVITMKIKTTYLKNIFDLCLYQFIAFTFLLKLSHKIFFTIFTVSSNQG